MPENETTPSKHIEKVMGFDFGLRRIGVAMGQTITRSANPVTTLIANNGEPDWEEVKRLMAHWRPDAIVVGRPVRMDGSRQEITTNSDKFAKGLQERFNIPLFRIDEHLSSVAAKEFLIEQMQTKKPLKGQLDAVSAKLILESWLRHHA